MYTCEYSILPCCSSRRIDLSRTSDCKLHDPCSCAAWRQRVRPAPSRLQAWTSRQSLLLACSWRSLSSSSRRTDRRRWVARSWRRRRCRQSATQRGQRHVTAIYVESCLRESFLLGQGLHSADMTCDQMKGLHEVRHACDRISPLLLLLLLLKLTLLLHLGWLVGNWLRGR